jgi:general L-amino acid transport system permease protein
MAVTQSYVRTDMLPQQAAPLTERGAVKWVRENLLSGPVNIGLTLLGIAAVYYILQALLPWLLNGVWFANSQIECREIVAKSAGEGASGACWAPIRERWHQWMFGFYPQDQYWRPVLAFVLMFLAFAPVLFDKVPKQLLWFTILFPAICFTLLWGGSVWTPWLYLLSLPAGWLAWWVYQQPIPLIVRVIYGAIVAISAAYVMYQLGHFAYVVSGDFIMMMDRATPTLPETESSGSLLDAIWWALGAISAVASWLLYAVLWVVYPLSWVVMYAGAAATVAYVLYSAWKGASFVGIIGGVIAVGAFGVFAAPFLAEHVYAWLPLALQPVTSDQFGGFLLAITIGVTAIAFSLPIGIILALGRQSDMLIVKTLCVGFIEFIRGVPLITLLFTASLLLQYFLPPETKFDIILRVIILVTLFSAAYLAEVIRGGLAALPRGQYEAADALGLDYWAAQRLIILPQALKISIPSIVSTFIGLFKDTTLVSFVGLLDPLRGVTNVVRADINWKGIYWEPYIFVGAIFFVFCFGMSRYSMYLENKLKTDHR